MHERVKKHISELCRRASYKLHTLRRIRKYLTVEKAKLLENVFINRQLNFVHPLPPPPHPDMDVCKSSIDKILKIHKRTRQIVYDVSDMSYENLLNRSDDISTHQKHLRYLAIGRV